MVKNWNSAKGVGGYGKNSALTGAEPSTPNEVSCSRSTFQSSLVAAVGQDAVRRPRGCMRSLGAWQGFLAGRVRDMLAGAAGRKVRVKERAPPGWAGTDLFAALLKPVQ